MQFAIAITGPINIVLGSFRFDYEYDYEYEI
jgi:hypothetical protein